MRRVLLLSAVLACLSAAVLAADANWPQFRGPGSRGVADGANLPDRWSATENVLWKQSIPGQGWSSPIVWGDRVFVTTAVPEGDTEEPMPGLYFGGNRGDEPDTVYQWKVLCLDLNTGDVLWEREAHVGVPAKNKHIKNSYASETPVTDGERVYAYFGNVGLFCYDMDGELLWQKGWDPVKTRFSWGLAASPVLHGDRLFIVNDNDEQSFLVALDKYTGEQIRRVDRDEVSNWATPFIWENELRTEIVTPGTKRVRSYDLDGNLLWELGGMSTISIPTPLARDGLLYICSGYVMDQRKPVFAIRPGASGDISLDDDATSNDYIAWAQKSAGPYNPSPLLYGDYFYVLLDRGFFACYDAKTGEEVYSQRRIPGSRAFTSSPWAYDGKIFCLNEFGTTYVIQAGPEFEILHTNELGEDAMGMATPAIAGDKLLIRTGDHLFCIAK